MCVRATYAIPVPWNEPKLQESAMVKVKKVKLSL
jgi:hypothetical protein